MIIPSLIAITGMLGGQITSASPHEFIGVRNLAVSPDGDQLAFTYRGDIWVASANGGRATMLTTNVEMDDYSVWSPDGKWIAYATDRNGNWDIYAVPVEGGQTVRLTYSSFSEIPVSWHGDHISFDGSMDKTFPGIYTLNVKDLSVNEVFVTNYRLDYPSFSPDGKAIAFTHKAMFGSVRPRYEGSGAGQLFTIGTDGKSRKEIHATGFQHLWPQFAPDGKSIYTVTVTEKTPSSRHIDEKPKVPFDDNAEKTPNIYKVDLNGRAVRMTNLVGGSGARYLSVARNTGAIFYENDGIVYRLASGGKGEPVKITGTVDDKGRVEQRYVITSGAGQATLSPDNKTVVFQANRELFSVPVTRGKGPNGADATQLTDYAGSDVEPLYAPDGKSVFFLSDREGANSLFRQDLESLQITKVYSNKNDVSSLRLTPDKKSLTFWVSGRDGGLMMLPVTGGTAQRIIDKPYGSNYNFSPDMAYLAYEKPLINGGFKPWENRVNIWVRDMATGNEVNVTKLNRNHTVPTWSADGNYLYFWSDRGPAGIFVLPAQQEDTPSNLLELKYEKPAGPVKTEFDFENVDARIRLFNAGASGSTMYSDPEKGDLYFVKGGNIVRTDYNGEKETPITRDGGVGRFDVSHDNNILFVLRSGVPTLVDIRKQNFPATGVEYRAVWVRKVNDERRAAFHEFWRIYNQQFYDEFFHRRDWGSIRDRYEPLLDGVAHRREMADVLNLMVGELESSHSEVGPAAGGERSESTAHPGFTIDYSYRGPGVRVKDVPPGAPGSYAKTRINPGDYVLRVNGQAVKADQHFLRLLNEETGRDLVFTVNSSPTVDGAREVKYRALSGGQFRQYIYQDTINWRRKYVEELSNGRITYVHIAGMGGGNLDTFNTEMWAYVQGKDAVIIDVRENGGGNIADILIDILERRLHMRYLPRDLDEIPGPGMLWDKPTVVMASETSFSNAEMFPAAMKALGLAKIVGMPTPGYVIYTYGGQLVDGTSIRLPNTGVYRTDGTPTENMGQKPDIQVDMTPEEYFSRQDPQLKRSVEELLNQLRRQG